MAETHYGRKLRVRIEQAIHLTEESLGKGDAQDYARYRQHVGVIEGLNVVLGICDDLDKEES